jgi:hypothetical protein
MMKGVEFAEVRDAILRAFNREAFDMLLYERLDFNRPDHVADGPFKVVVTNVLKEFENEGRDPDLIAEVAAARPLKPDVQEVYRKYARALIGEARDAEVEAEKLRTLERYGLVPRLELQQAGKTQWPSSADLKDLLDHVRKPSVSIAPAATPPPPPPPTALEGFQKRVKAALPWLDPRLWGTPLFQTEARVCRIEVDGIPVGTGFLVGPDAVLTNYHVLATEIAVKATGDRITCLFDYRVLSGGVESEGTRVGLASAWDDWHIDSSPPLPNAAEHACDPLPTPDQLDHALVRLASPFGREPITSGGPARGWVRVPATAPTLTEKMPVMILQHPKSLPIKLAFDAEAVLTVNANRTRVRYATNTEDGSSGSPCFNATWGLIALHHFGEPNVKPATYNQGVPIDAIRSRLTRVGRADAFGSESS